MSAPELPYFELSEFDGQDTTVALDKDYSFSPVYTTDAGAACAGNLTRAVGIAVGMAHCVCVAQQIVMTVGKTRIISLSRAR